MFEEIFHYKLIYICTVYDTNHKGLLKIGETTVKTNCAVEKLTPNCNILNKAARIRIKQFSNTAGVNFELLYTELAAYKFNGKLENFRDYDVHKVLLNSNVKKKSPPGSTGREWFKVSLNTAIQAIKAVKQREKNLSGVIDEGDDFTPFILRPEQEDAVNLTIKTFRKGNRMLWNAKMRFGKTLTALELVRRIGFAKTIILTHRPVVDDEWYDHFNKIFHGNKDFIYGSKKTGYKQIDELLTSGKKFVYFASIQDLRGSESVGGNFFKNEKIFSTDWDFVIVDEAHEGTTTILGDKVIQNIVKEKSKLLALSGTPFNIIDTYEENVFTWDYVAEQIAKSEWDNKYCGDPNPYADLPELKIFTYNLGKVLKNSAYVELEDKAFNFREFFRTDDADNFVHESDVKKFLDLLTKPTHTNYPYSNEEFRKIFSHSLWMIPGVRAGRALSKLLKSHKVFQFFKIVNVAGNGDADEESADALEKVKNAIATSEYTITLSCGRLTTGVTVPEWSAVFMLAGSFSTSAASYMQTIFRAMNPCTSGGKAKQFGYVFDFAPDRTLKVIAASAAISAKAGEIDDNDRNILGKFLNFCPIISFDGSEMIQYDTNRLLQQLYRAYSDRAARKGFDDSCLYNEELFLKVTDSDLEDFKKLNLILSSSKSRPAVKQIDINAQGFTDEQYEKIKIAKRKPARQLSDEELQLLEEIKQQKKLIKSLRSTLRDISIRMPLLIYGADIPLDKDFTLDMFFKEDIVDSASWEEFMPKGVTKDFFQKFIKYYNPEIFKGAGRKVRDAAHSADELTPTERVKKIAELFNTFKNPDKETVLTPFRVVNLHLSISFGGYDFFDESHKNILPTPRFVDTEIFYPNSKILEINSKTGLYPLYVAYSIYRARLGNRDENSMPLDFLQNIWDKTVADNIFVICKTPMAKTITKRTLGGFRNVSVNAHFFDNLVDDLKFEPQKFIRRVKNKNTWKKGKGTMKFDAVVGNPPYQLAIPGDNKNFATPIYHEFLKASFKLADKVSLIHPARFLFNAGATPKDFNRSMLNNNHFKIVKYFPDSREIFPTSDIKGGVVISLYDANQNFGTIGTFTPFPELNSILKKVTSHKDFYPLSEIMYSRTIYRITDKVHTDFPDAQKNLSAGHLYDMSTNIFDAIPQIFFDDKPDDGNEYIQIVGRKNNERICKWIRRDYVNNPAPLEKFKVLVPDSNGSGAIGEQISTPLVGLPLVGSTETFITVGAFDTRAEAAACYAYIRTKFCRAMLGILKVTQHNPPQTWAKVPIQDFTLSSDIDWSKSVAEIDKQLYAKYDLSDEEIKFIETNIKPM